MGDVKNVLASFWGVVWNERRTTSLTHHIIGALNISKHKEQYYINIQAMDKSIGDDGERPSLARHYQMLHELFEKFGLSSSLFGSPHRPILQFLTACNSRSSLDTFTTNFLPPSFFFLCVLFYGYWLQVGWAARLLWSAAIIAARQFCLFRRVLQLVVAVHRLPRPAAVELFRDVDLFGRINWNIHNVAVRQLDLDSLAARVVAHLQRIPAARWRCL